MRNLEEDIAGLPGNDAIRKGLQDLAAGTRTIESYLIQIGSDRLRLAGIPLHGTIDPDADHRLFDLLRSTEGLGAHSQYNAWIRQLVSFERALERRLSKRTNG